MPIIADVVLAVLALLHLGFLVLEMFFWTKPFGLRTFRLTPEIAQASASLAANQGLYNGFLAAGLVWGLLSGDFHIRLFFVGCVIVAGIFGGITAKRSILWMQGLPGVLTLLAVVAARRS